MVKTVRNALLFRMRNFRSRKTALFLVVTILVSVFAVNGDRESVYAAQKNAVYQKYSTKIDNRIKKIQNHQTDIQTVGTVFYISSSTGNDQNDGLSPETAWKTCAKMNEDADGVIHDSVEKYGGATVLFKRGDVWKRDGISLWYPNMIYSTYGTGEKPVFDFSLADAADPSMWKLKKGTKNIWIYQDKVPFLGSLTLNDRYSADNHDAYYDYKTKKWYECCPNGHYDQKTEKVCCNYKQKKYVNVNKLPENSFFVDVRPSKKWLEKGVRCKIVKYIFAETLIRILTLPNISVQWEESVPASMEVLPDIITIIFMGAVRAESPWRWEIRFQTRS